jgi:hypothetical protein
MKEFIQNPAGFIPLKVRKGYFQNTWKMKNKSTVYLILWMYYWEKPSKFKALQVIIMNTDLGHTGTLH